MFQRYKLIMVAVALIGTATPALAQSMLQAPSEIAVCLCLERSIGQRAAEMSARRPAYESLQMRVAALSSELERSRASVDTSNDAAVEAYRAKVVELDTVRNELERSALPDYQAAVTGYNERVTQFTQRCSARPVDPVVTDQVRRSLVCSID